LSSRRIESYLNNLIDQVQSLITKARSFSKLTEAQLNWKSNEGNWSIAQCLDHLVTINQSYFSRIGQMIEKGKQKGLLERKPFRSNLLGKLSINSMKPGSNKKYKTPTLFQPSSSLLNKNVIDKFVENQNEMIQLINKAKGLDLNKIKIVSPVSSIVRFRLGDCLQFLIVHEERHIVQANRVEKVEEFPTI